MISYFADDTTITVSDLDRKTMRKKLTAALNETNEWFTGNNLCLNKNKRQIVFLTTDIRSEVKSINFLALPVVLCYIRPQKVYDDSWLWGG